MFYFSGLVLTQPNEPRQLACMQIGGSLLPNNFKTLQTCLLLIVSKILITNIQTLILSGLIKLQLLIGSQKD